jgi:hypothetical protein
LRYSNWFYYSSSDAYYRFAELRFSDSAQTVWTPQYVKVALAA